MKQIDFSEGKITQNIIQSALPLMVAQIMNLLYSMIDRVYIGRIPGTGTTALGAIGLCFPIIIIITAFTNMYGQGGAPLFSIERGRGDDDQASRIMDMAFFLEVTTAIVLTVVLMLFSRPILVLFGASETSLPYCMAYLRIYVLGTLFSMISIGMNPFINAQGFPSVGMITVVLGAVANLILDPLFIFVLNLGIRGAAVATVLSQGLSCAFVLHFLRKGRSEIPLHWMSLSTFLSQISVAKDIVLLGTASFIMLFTNSLTQIVCNRMLGRYGGDLYISIMTIISSVRQVCETPAFAVAEGASPVLSYNYGANRPDNVKKGIRIMFLLLISYSLFIWLLVLWKPQIFIGIFSSDKTIMKDSIPALHLYFFAFVFMTFQHTGQTTFKALNKKNHAIFFSLFRKVIIVVPLTILLPGIFHLGTNGVFMAEPISNIIGGLACFLTMLLTVIPELNRMSQK